jgi:excisionase family DNA binding protein
MNESKPHDRIESDPFAGLKVSLESWFRGIVKDEVEKVLRNLQGNPRPSSTLLTVEELAEALHVPRSWIYDRTRKKTIPHVKVGRYPRFDLNEVLAWLEFQKGRRSEFTSELKSRAQEYR